MASLGLDKDEWSVVNPHIRDKIREQSFHFAASTNETTTLKLDAAHAELRKQLEEGIVDRGETLTQLRKRVSTIFTEAKESRAFAIAATEASRAVHLSQIESAKQSGVSTHKSLLLSSDACPRCHAVKASEPDGGWPLDDDMATIGDHPYYSRIPAPPIHVHCQCSLVTLVNSELLADSPELPEGVTPEDVVGIEAEPEPVPPAKLPKLADVEAAVGVRFVPSEGADNADDATVIADVAALEASLAKDAGSHVGPGGTGAAISGRYAEFQRFLAKARAESIPVEMPRMGLDADGNATVINGRHRFAVLRDEGVTALPVSVDKDAARKFKRKFGAKAIPS